MEIEMQKIFKKFGIKNLKCPPLIQVRPGFWLSLDGLGQNSSYTIYIYILYIYIHM
jgi:hypothetical protein